MLQPYLDKEILKAFNRRELSALKAIFDKYFQSITYAAMNTITDPDKINDLVPQCFADLLKQHAILYTEADILRFLYKSVQLRCNQVLVEQPSLGRVPTYQKHFQHLPENENQDVWKNEMIEHTALKNLQL